MKAEDLTTGPIRKHMTQLAWPSIMGSLFSTLYNVVDTMWAGKVGIDLSKVRSEVHSIGEFWQQAGDFRALTGLTVSFPIFLVMLAISIGLLNGTLALIGNQLGRKDQQQAHSYFAQAILYAFIVSILFLAILPALPLLLNLMGAKDPIVIRYARDYIATIVAGNILFALSFVFSAVLISCGDTRTQRNVAIITFFLNIGLDPLLMFGWGPIPALGLRGIAIATLLSQLLGMIIMYFRLRSYQAFAGMNLRSFAPRWKILATITTQSFPPTLNMAIVSFLLGLVNRYANIYGGSAAVAAYGISLRMEQIALLPSIGVRTALTSIASQNNGAGKIERMESAYRVAIISGLLFLVLIMLPIGWLFPQPILRLFTTDATTIAIAKSYLAICVLTFFAYMLINFSGSIFQACQIPQLFLYVTLLRNCILPLITFALFAKAMGLQGLWFAILFNNWLVAIIAVWLCLRVLRQRKVQAES